MRFKSGSGRGKKNRKKISLRTHLGLGAMKEMGINKNDQCRHANAGIGRLVVCKRKNKRPGAVGG
jgi:hypothetical protein